MTVSLIVCLSACAGLIALILFKPSARIKGHTISIYWLPAFAGGVLLLLSGVLPVKEAWAGLTASGEMNPLKILAFFLSLTFLSVYLDELGFFRQLSFMLLRHAKGSKKKLFFLLYAMVSVLTVFTSNDIVVLTFTPFICSFCKEEKISPIPFLVGEFVAANTWSMALVIGNPTNVYLAAATGIGFGEYLSVMWLPTVMAGVAAFCTLLLIFRKSLSSPISPVAVKGQVVDRGLLLIGVVHLAACVICLAFSSYLGVPMWLASVLFAASLAICSTVYGAGKRRFRITEKLLGHSVLRAPWELVPFVLSMFLIVLSLQKYGLTDRIAGVLSVGGDGEIWTYGVSSFLAANVINNIPMSVLFGGVIGANLGAGITAQSVYATVIGSNLGAYFTPIGALAGIMWMGLLKTYGVKFGFKDFVRYGGVVAAVSLVFALLGLWLVL